MIATNGKGYREIAPGKVRRIDAIDLDKFYTNDGEEELNDDLARHNTKQCAKYLKKKTRDLELAIVFANGRINAHGFKIEYEGFGFRIIDTWNFNKVINVNDYHNDFAGPEDVVEFFRKNWNRKIHEPEEAKAKTKYLDKLAKKFTVTVDKKKQKAMDELEAKRKEKIRKQKLRQPAKKFVGVDWEEDMFDVRLDKKTKLVHFRYKGPGGRSVSSYKDYHVFIAQFVLHNFPKAMPMLMKVVNETAARYDLDEIDYDRFEKDKLVEYDLKLLKACNPASKKHLLAVCQEIMWYHEMPSPLDFHHYSAGSKFHKGMEVRVFFPDSYSWDYGKVTRLSPMKVLFDGGVQNIMAHQKIEIL